MKTPCCTDHHKSKHQNSFVLYSCTRFSASNWSISYTNFSFQQYSIVLGNAEGKLFIYVCSNWTNEETHFPSQTLYFLKLLWSPPYNWSLLFQLTSDERNSLKRFQKYIFIRGIWYCNEKLKQSIDRIMLGVSLKIHIIIYIEDTNLNSKMMKLSIISKQTFVATVKKPRRAKNIRIKCLRFSFLRRMLLYIILEIPTTYS